MDGALVGQGAFHPSHSPWVYVVVLEVVKGTLRKVSGNIVILIIFT